MSIISTERPVLTTEQKQQQAALRVQNQATQLFRQVGQSYQQIAQTIFANQNGLTPQQVFDAIGANSVELRMLAEALVTLTNTAVPDALPTEFPFELTSNQDGTITVGDPV